MKILITGTTGYIAKRLVLRLLDAGHELVCCVRDLQRIPDEIEYKKNIKFIKVVMKYLKIFLKKYSI